MEVVGRIGCVSSCIAVLCDGFHAGKSEVVDTGWKGGGGEGCAEECLW